MPAAGNTSRSQLATQDSARAAQVASLAASLQIQNVFIDPGPSNRLTLALKSGFTDEVAFALEQLLHTSALDPELVRLELFPGLAEGLVDVIANLVEVETTAPRAPDWASNFISRKRQLARRQAIESAVVLRNLSTLEANSSQLQQLKALRTSLANVLDLFSPRNPAEPTRSSDLIELQVLALELLEVIAPRIVLRPRLPATSAPNGAADASEPLDPSCRLYDILSPLVHSSDRAVTVGAFKCLAVLAGHEHVAERNEPFFTFSCSVFDAPNPVTRAIQLLPIDDLQLSLNTLEFLYGYSQIPSNADSLASRPDTAHLFNLLLSKLAIETTRYDTQVEPLERARKRIKLEEASQAQRTPQAEPRVALSSAELQLLFPIQEPRRVIKWMQWTLESHPGAEVTQVSLWNAYRATFEGMDQQEGQNRMMTASEVIKTTTEAFPEASAQVIVTGPRPTDRKFIIRGLRVKDRQELARQFKKRWSSKSRSGERAFDQPPASLANPTTADDSQILAAVLQRFLAEDVPLPNALEEEEDEAEVDFFIQHSVWQVDSEAQSGPAHYAALVVRNMARAIKYAATPIRQVDADGESILYLLTGQTESGQDVATAPKLSAKNVGVLLGLEERILDLMLRYKSFGATWAEIMSIITGLQAIQKAQAARVAEGA